ncbi:FG-GAP repeat protein, partial [bacterium]|nr:FG-GAP repeat protein [candidate division CSSED10-310 bacterium]
MKSRLANTSCVCRVHKGGMMIVLAFFLFFSGAVYGTTEKQVTSLVYPRISRTLSDVPIWTGEADISGAGYGVCVATAGDVNGDGYADVIVGAHEYDDGHLSGGRVFVYHGNANGVSDTPSWSLASDTSGAMFGLSVGTAGDTNGDGFSEIIIGAPQYGGGRIIVVPGSSSGLSTDPSDYWIADCTQAGAWAGMSVGTAGDVNNDGYSDIIFGAPFFNN